MSKTMIATLIGSAICRVDNGSSCLLNGNQGAHGGCAGKNLLQEQGQLPQADAAGHTLAAALGMAEPQEAQRHIYRAKPRRAGGNPPFYITIEILHHSLGPAGRLDIQSAHSRSTPFLMI